MFYYSNDEIANRIASVLLSEKSPKAVRDVVFCIKHKSESFADYCSVYGSLHGFPFPKGIKQYAGLLEQLLLTGSVELAGQQNIQVTARPTGEVSTSRRRPLKGSNL